MAGGPAHKHAA